MTHRGVATAGRPTAGGAPLGPAVASFLAERDLAPSSHRVYVLALDRHLDRLGADTPLAQVSPRALADFMTGTYPHLAPASYNRVVATLASLFAYTTCQGWTSTSPATGLERRRPRLDRAAHARARAIPAPELLAFLDADHPVREKTLWWLLYETAARAGEVLALNVADLDPARRRAVVVGKGGRAEVIGWETKTARLAAPTSPKQASGSRC
jgi:site-specific recombinase XerD